MLKIRPLAMYHRAKYPAFGMFHNAPKTTPGKIRDITVLAGLAVMLDSCLPFSTSGVPVPPRMISEADARNMIDKVFVSYGLSVEHDLKLRYSLNGNDSTLLEIDGYDDSLNVGYEYISVDDRLTFTRSLSAHLDSLKLSDSPHILPIDALPDSERDSQLLEQISRSFLDSLKAHGVI